MDSGWEPIKNLTAVLTAGQGRQYSAGSGRGQSALREWVATCCRHENNARPKRLLEQMRSGTRRQDEKADVLTLRLVAVAAPHQAQDEQHCQVDDIDHQHGQEGHLRGTRAPVRSGAGGGHQQCMQTQCTFTGHGTVIEQHGRQAARAGAGCKREMEASASGGRHRGLTHLLPQIDLSGACVASREAIIIKCRRAAGRRPHTAGAQHRRRCALLPPLPLRCSCRGCVAGTWGRGNGCDGRQRAGQAGRMALGRKWPLVNTSSPAPYN